MILVFHWSKLSLLNFCSSDSIVREGIPDIDVQGGYFSSYIIRLLTGQFRQQWGP